MADRVMNSVRRVREARMMTAKRLSVESGVSQSTISKVERGGAALTEEVAAKLAKALSTTPEVLMGGAGHVGTTVFFRSMSAATKSARVAQNARSEMVDAIVAELDAILDFPGFNVPTIGAGSVDEISGVDIERVASDLRAAWGLDDGPVANLVASAEAHGVVVCMFPFGVETLDALSRMGSTSRPVAMVNTELGNAFRWRFDVAHELGHMVLHRGIPGIDSLPSDVRRVVEAQGHRFAGALLLPEGPFRDSLVGLSLEDFKMAKPTWGVSIQAMVRRAYDLGLLDESQYTSRQVAISRKRWRKSEPYDGDRMPEVPTLLRTCVSLAVREGLLDVRALMSRCGVPEDVFEDVVGVPRGFVASGGFGTASKVEVRAKGGLRFV
ncbi:ImmA/IrrE family metallo-endopeptidase [Thermophilibacter sp.]|uniref:ImmA/IrrE family metallo-endopeptidase n=1 Tax=Thermophilibacter sp. TaxID=2847309 RepID=UPI003A94E62A